MENTQLPLDFKEFLRLLSGHDVRYLLIGGYAVGYYGYPRATLDLDVWISNDEDNARRMAEVMCEFGFSRGDISHEVFMRADGVVRLGVPPMRLEVLMGLSGVEFEQCYKRSRWVRVDDVEVRVIDLADLRRNKTASGRYKDLDDLDKLPETWSEPVD